VSHDPVPPAHDRIVHVHDVFGMSSQRADIGKRARGAQNGGQVFRPHVVRHILNAEEIVRDAAVHQKQHQGYRRGAEYRERIQSDKQTTFGGAD